MMRPDQDEKIARAVAYALFGMLAACCVLAAVGEWIATA